MNKAFTANINDQVTARGYLDENNQLIMLEPEGSGGSGDSDFTIATMTVVGEPTAGLIPQVRAINITDNVLIDYLEAVPGTHSIVLYRGSQQGVYIPESYTVTGSAELVPNETDVYKVTGDFTITYVGGGE